MYQLIERHRSLSIIGLCKNAGKTTALNRIVRDSARFDVRLALTSIGRDGEDTDLATGTKKPGIYVPEGTIIATASGLLPHCDITREILCTTGIPTPLGEVVVLRALSDGSVQLAGPSIVEQLAGLKEVLYGFSADKIIIDGAVGRKSLCSGELADAVLLCAGASCGSSVDAVVSEAVHLCEMLTLPELDHAWLREHADRQQPGKFLLLDGDAAAHGTDSAELERALRAAEEPRERIVFVRGALTDSVLRPLLTSRLKLEGVTFAARDASKIMLSPSVRRKLQIRGASLGVVFGVQLAAVCVNPFSAYGNHFDRERFLASMSERAPVPVFDAEDDGLDHL